MTEPGNDPLTGYPAEPGEESWATSQRVDVIVYSVGLCFASACCLPTEDLTSIEAAVNALHPTGIGSLWRVSAEPFSSGESNPCRCEVDSARIHVLLEC